MATIKRLITVALFFLAFMLLALVAASAPGYSDASNTAPFETATNETASITASIKKATAEPLEISAFVTTANEADAEGKVYANDPGAAPGSDISAAGKLNLLGLLEGVGALSDGSPNLAVDRAPTRTEAVVIIVRLIGGEADALNGNRMSPFTDVPEWAKPYLGYAFENGLILGVGGSTFSGIRDVTAAEYITLTLRALGYISGADFEWDKAWELSDELGITGGHYNSNTSSFTRGDAAEISFNSLGAKLNGSDKTLCDHLVDAGVFTGDVANALGAGVIADISGQKQDIPLSQEPENKPATEPATEPEQKPVASDLEWAVFLLVNNEREKAGLNALVWNDELAAVARAHSKDMSLKDYFSHINLDGQKPADRKRAAGLVFRYSAENIARGYRTPEAVVAAWMSSPSHKSAILSDYPVSIGVGFYDYYWTMNMID